MYAKLHHNIPLSSRDRAIITFSEFGARQNLDRWKMTFHNLNVYAEVYQNILLSSRDNAIFTFSEFDARQSLDRWLMSFCNSLTFFSEFEPRQKTQPISSVIWQSHGVHLVNINVYAKFQHSIPLSSRDSAIITFIRIWSSAKPRPMKNVILQSLGLDLVNINVFATVYQTFPLSLRDRAIFTFSEFGARQSLDRW